MLVPSVAVIVKDEVVSELTALAVPEKVPLELNVIPEGKLPDVIDKAILSPSSSVAVTVVIFELALFASDKIPKEPEATQNTGEASILKAPPKLADKPEADVTLIP